MRFDTLKLDKSLIDYIGEFGGDRLIKHTVALAKDMGLYVTAEGVENYDQVEFLKDVKCDNIQGFFYAKPVPVSDFEQKLVEDKISDKCIYQGGKVYTFSMMLDNVRRAFSEAAAERVSDDFALQISLCGDTEGVMYVEHKKGKISIQPYEYNDRDAEIRIDAFTLNNILKGIGTLENSIRTGRVEYSGDWNVITDFDRIVMKR